MSSGNMRNGTTEFQNLSTAFYSRVQQDPRLRHLFPGKSMRCAIEQFTAFLVQYFDGPAEETQKRWWLSLRESHARFKIGPAERAAWLEDMAAALDDIALAEPLRSELWHLFEQSSLYVLGERNLEAGELWARQVALDDAVAAIRSLDRERAIRLTQSLRDRKSVFVGLLGLMTANPLFVPHVKEQLLADPSLASERHAGRALLHNACANGSLQVVELLLQSGADPNVRTDGSHTPLYCLANEYGGPGGGGIVRVMVRAGADVNARDGVKRCGPLHMAARRGHVEIAEALLDCGADPRARDTSGGTPLQRALNCKKRAVAALLAARFG